MVTAEERYVQTASDFQVPCFIMCSRGTPWEKAQAAPPLQKSWNVRTLLKERALEMSFRCLRATESVNGTNPLFLGIRKTGELSVPLNVANMILRAMMGHRLEPAKSGSETVVKSFLFYIVLDHLITNTAPESPKITSPRASCLVWSNEATECGRTLDSLRSEKKTTRYKGLKITGNCILSHC